MKCANPSCQTDIADNALICYRCGRATRAPRVAPPQEGSIFEKPRRGVPWAVWAGAALAAAGALWAYLAG